MNHEFKLNMEAQKRGLLFVLICILHVLSEPGRAVHIIHIDSAAVLSEKSRQVCRNA